METEYFVALTPVEMQNHIANPGLVGALSSYSSNSNYRQGTLRMSSSVSQR